MVGETARGRVLGSDLEVLLGSLGRERQGWWEEDAGEMALMSSTFLTENTMSLVMVLVGGG